MTRGKGKVDSLKIKRMTAAFVSGELPAYEIARNLGVSPSTVSSYRRMFDGVIPITRYIGYKLSRAGVLSQYPSEVTKPKRPFTLSDIPPEPQPEPQPEIQPELPGTPEILPIRIAITQLVEERNKINTAIEALEALL